MRKKPSLTRLSERLFSSQPESLLRTSLDAEPTFQAIPLEFHSGSFFHIVRAQLHRAIFRAEPATYAFIQVQYKHIPPKPLCASLPTKILAGPRSKWIFLRPAACLLIGCRQEGRCSGKSTLYNNTYKESASVIRSEALSLFPENDAELFQTGASMVMVESYSMTCSE